MSIDVENVDFVDFGTKTGRSFAIGYRLGGTRGLGIDIRPRMVEQAVANGLNVMQGDATELDIPDNSVRFSVLNHFLEHLPSLDDVRKAIGTAVRISTDCVYLGGPVFDDEEYLASLNLKTFWSDWTGHPCHLTCQQVEEILSELQISKESYRMHRYKHFNDSMSEFVHPINAPPDQHEYDADVHPPKPQIRFDRTCYREWQCIISLNGSKHHYRCLHQRGVQKLMQKAGRLIERMVGR